MDCAYTHGPQLIIHKKERGLKSLNVDLIRVCIPSIASDVDLLRITYTYLLRP